LREKKILLISVLFLRKLSLREFKTLGCGHSASKGLQSSTLICLALKTYLLVAVGVERWRDGGDKVLVLPWMLTFACDWDKDDTSRGRGIIGNMGHMLAESASVMGYRYEEWTLSQKWL
jgi:hypothetical protein